MFYRVVNDCACILHHHAPGVRWGLPVLCVIGKQDAIPREVMLDFVMSG